jgi:hypothetical protein
VKMKTWQIWTVAAVVVVAVGLGCLFGGRAWGASGSDDNGKNRTAGQNWGNGNGPSGMPGEGSGQFGGRNGGGMVIGSIIAVDATSITVKTSDGSTKIVFVGSSATISLATTGSASDLKTGENVVVSGTTNTDGTVTANSIRLGEILNVGGTPPADGTAPSGGAPATGSGTATTPTTTN